jgi:hypothetical protein
MIAAMLLPYFKKGRPVATRVFKTRRGRITLTDATLIYEPKRDPQRRVSIARADITEVSVRHRGGVLNISHVGRRTAEALRAALEP